MNLMYNKKKYWKLIASIGLVIVFFQACVKDSFNFDKLAQIEYNPNLAAPLVFASYTIKSIIEKMDTGGLIREDANHFLTIAYKTSLFSQNAASIVTLPEQSSSMPFSFEPDEITIFDAMHIDSSYTIKRTESLDFSAGGSSSTILLDSLFFKSGTINLDVSSGMAHDMDINISIPKATHNGVPLQKIIHLQYAGGTTAVQGQIDLAGYKFDMTSGLVKNKIDLVYSVKLTKKTGTSSGQITINQAYKNMSFSKLFGYFGQLPLATGKDTMVLAIFANAKGPMGIHFDELKVKLNFQNSFGLPIGASIASLYGFTDILPPYKAIDDTVAMVVTSPSFAEIGQSATSSFILDKNNSHLSDVINNRPHNLVFDIIAKSNPHGNVGSNFILDSSKFKADMEIELPLDLRASNYIYQDTQKFSFGTSMSQIDYVTLRATINNGFPFNVGIQAYFCDSANLDAAKHYVIIDSLIHDSNNLLMASAIVDPITGKVSSPTQKTTILSVTTASVERFKRANKMIIVGNLSTYNSGAKPVKIYTDYKLDFKLAGQIQLKAKFNTHSKK